MAKARAVPKGKAIQVVTDICAAVEYLVDRGEMDGIDEVLTHVRYTNNRVDSFDVKVRGGSVVRITAEVVK